jgi:hypothetical protein
MALSEVVSASGTTSYAQVGFVISLVLFSLIVLWALLRPRSSMQAAALSVLDDDKPHPLPKAHGHGH